MTRELLVEARPGEARAALFADGVATELRVERAGGVRAGDLFLARVGAKAPGLAGVFVELGEGEAALLKDEAGTAPPHEGATVVVQVRREAQGGKGPLVTRRIALPGRFLTLLPTREGLRFAAGMEAATQANIAALLADLAAEGEGLSAAAAAATVSREALAAELAALRERWRRALARAAEPDLAPGVLAAAERPLARVLASFAAIDCAILADREATLAEARLWALAEAPHLATRLRLERGRRVDEEIAAALAEALEPEVALAGGGRLRFATTPAGTLVDVDAGRAAGGRGAAAATALAVNLAAAAALARHLRLRNLGGAVIVDFVGMARRAERARVAAALSDETSRDPERVECLGWTRLGHFELRRRRRRPPVAELMLREGRAAERSALAIALDALAAAARDGEARAAQLRLHPAVAAALASPAGGAARAELDARRRQPLALLADAALGREEFRLEPG